MAVYGPQQHKFQVDFRAEENRGHCSPQHVVEGHYKDTQNKKAHTQSYITGRLLKEHGAQFIHSIKDVTMFIIIINITTTTVLLSLAPSIIIITTTIIIISKHHHLQASSSASIIVSFNSRVVWHSTM